MIKTALFQSALVILLLVALPAHAKQLTGEGYGKTEKEAKKEALGDLSSAIQAEVKQQGPGGKAGS